VRDIVAVGAVEVLPIDVALVLYEFSEVSTPSAEYQIVRRRQAAEELHVRAEYDPAAAVDLAALRQRVADAFRARLGVAVRLELVARGSVPRFAYKAARVVDE